MPAPLRSGSSSTVSCPFHLNNSSLIGSFLVNLTQARDIFNEGTSVEIGQPEIQKDTDVGDGVGVVAGQPSSFFSPAVALSR